MGKLAKKKLGGKLLVTVLLLFLASYAYASTYGSGPYGRGAYGKRIGTVAFSLEMNINGPAGDTAEVDGRGVGVYTTSNISNYYGCIQDATISQTPVFGIVFSGGSFDYVNLSANLTEGNSFRIKMSQNLTGNRFIIPVTKNGCSVIKSKFETIRSLGYLPSAFVPFASGKNPLEISVSFPGIDLVGDFSKTGSFKVVLEKNETDQIVQIIGTP